MDLRLFRPPNKPSVLLSGIQDDCTKEELRLRLNDFGEIDEVSVDNKGNGVARWKNFVSISKLLENLENIPVSVIKPIGASFPTHQPEISLQEEYGDDEEFFAVDHLLPLKPVNIPKISHECSLNSSASTDVSYDSSDEVDPKVIIDSCVLKDVDGNICETAGPPKKDKSSTYYLHKYKRWVSKGFVSLMNHAAEKSRSFSSMQY